MAIPNATVQRRSVSFTEKVTCISRPLQPAVRRPDKLVDEFPGNHGELYHPSEQDKVCGTQALPGLFICKSKNCLRHPIAERLIVHELLEKFHIVLQHIRHDTGQCLVMLNAGILLVGILAGILVGRVR
jgi:hypothetical protein